MAQAQQVVYQRHRRRQRPTTVYQVPNATPSTSATMRDFRDNLESPGQGAGLAPQAERQVPISQLADHPASPGPSMIRDENGLLTGYVYIDLAGRDRGSYVADANRALSGHATARRLRRLLERTISSPWQRVNHRLLYAIPLTLAVVLFLIYINTRSWIKTSIVLLAVPFSAVGAVWLLYLLHYNMSVAVWVGLIGLLSIDAETGVFMLLYLDLAWEDARMRNRLRTIDDLRQAIVNGAAKRLRPKFMTFATTCIGLLPVMWSMGPGSDVMKRIAAPMVGGILTSFLLELLVYPVIYELWRQRSLQPHHPERIEDQSAVSHHDLVMTGVSE